ncbi:MAG: glycosyltransferase family 39 protein [Treponema sp.]|nr:glycosyltransferase family 39 protein [Treponema sp.]MCL2129200.1 glycosyltransferase family 39 protein [Treponema sp.]
MIRLAKIILTTACIAGVLLGAALTAYINIRENKNVFGEWLAPIRINIEINYNYSGEVSIYSPVSFRNDNPMFTRSETIVPANFNYDDKNIQLFAELNPGTFHTNLYLRFPWNTRSEIIDAIDNVSIFIGNKLCYYSNADIRNFTMTYENDNCLLLIPDLYYSRSLFVKNWVNYYGDFNFAVRAIMNFILYPFKFAVSYLFLIALALLYRDKISAVYGSISKSPGLWTGIALMLIIALGFILRINGYVRHSGWSDEIYSAVKAGNPNFPFIATFMDPGNPPLYFILLRYWFKIFGWTEEAGTMLSVILGTLAIPALYLFVKEYYGEKTALLASLFMALSGFAIDYSHEMRAYILKVFMAPLVSLFFFRYLKNQSIKNLFLYILVSVIIANSHYYAVLFIMANFIFYCFYEVFNNSFKFKKMLIFLTGNIITALTFMPYFLYQMLVMKFDFERVNVLKFEHILIMLVIIVLAVSLLIYHKKNKIKILPGEQLLFILYSLSIPVLIFSLAFFITIAKPMMNLKYLWPVSFPYFISVGAFLVSQCKRNKKIQYVAVFLVWAISLALYIGKARIDQSNYQIARAYIAADAAAHPDKKSCMLDNAPANAAYYGFEDLPLYSPYADYDVLYVYNDIFSMSEEDQLLTIKDNNLNIKEMLVIYLDDETAIYKKYLR